MSPTVPTPDPTISKRALDVIQWLATVAGSLAILWGFMAKVGKPFVEWRRRRMAEVIREVLTAELSRLDGICDREEQILDGYQKVLARQEAIFRDLDMLIEIALDNRDRLDEMNALMDELGLSSRDRRERAIDVDNMIDTLNERRKARRRKLPIHDKGQEQ